MIITCLFSRQPHEGYKSQHGAHLSPGSNWLIWLTLTLESRSMWPTIYSTDVFSSLLLAEKTISVFQPVSRSASLLVFSHSLTFTKTCRWRHFPCHLHKNSPKTAVIFRAKLCEETEWHQPHSALMPGTMYWRYAQSVGPAENEVLPNSIPSQAGVTIGFSLHIFVAQSANAHMLLLRRLLWLKLGWRLAAAALPPLVSPSLHSNCHNNQHKIHSSRWNGTFA